MSDMPTKEDIFSEIDQMVKLAKDASALGDDKIAHASLKTIEGLAAMYGIVSGAIV